MSFISDEFKALNSSFSETNKLANRIWLSSALVFSITFSSSKSTEETVKIFGLDLDYESFLIFAFIFHLFSGIFFAVNQIKSYETGSLCLAYIKEKNLENEPFALGFTQADVFHSLFYPNHNRIFPILKQVRPYVSIEMFDLLRRSIFRWIKLIFDGAYASIPLLGALTILLSFDKSETNPQGSMVIFMWMGFLIFCLPPYLAVIHRAYNWGEITTKSISKIDD